MSGANGKQEPLVGYLQGVELENVRSIASFKWEVTPGPGWNVLLGDNGSGKSTFLRAVSWLLLSLKETGVLRVDFMHWTCGDEPADLYVWGTAASGAKPFGSSIRVGRQAGGAIDVAWLADEFHGLFLAGFGPFRRFTGRDAEHDQQIDAFPRVARVASLFDERFTLAESLAWLKLLRFKELEQDHASATLLASIHTFVNQDGFLPDGTKLDRITSDAVLFRDANGAEVPVDELSDGYRSILSLTFELIRQLASHYGAEHVFNASATAVNASGIVLIDEVDAHLHPSWQRRIGVILRKCFPNIQFVVTTHSALICQAATADTDTVYRLACPGTDEEAHKVTGAEHDRLLYGDLADAYETEAMGHIGRSEKAQALVDRLGRLNRKEIDVGLTQDERKEQRWLREIFGALPETRA